MIKIYYEDVNSIIGVRKIFEENSLTKSNFISGPKLMIKTFKNKLINLSANNNKKLTDNWE
jgi:hypothetical protein